MYMQICTYMKKYMCSWELAVCLGVSICLVLIYVHMYICITQVTIGRGRARAYGYCSTIMRSHSDHLEHATQAEMTNKVHVFMYMYV